MKRIVFTLITVLLVAFCIFSACKDDSASINSSDPSSESGAVSGSESSIQQSGIVEISEISPDSGISEIIEVSDDSSETDVSAPEVSAESSDHVSSQPESSVPENSKNESSRPDESSAVSQPAESSEPEESSQPDESSNPSDIYVRPDDAVEVLFARYTNNPAFVLIGTCAQDAVVTADLDGTKTSVNSYKGWFSVTFTKVGSVHNVTFTQTVNGREYDIPHTYQVRPIEPGDTGAGIVAGTDNFQFFLTKMLPDFTGGNLYGTSAINNLKSRVESRLRELKSLNPQGEIIYMVVPSSMTVYPELVPSKYRPATGKTRLDQVYEALKSAGATVIDVRDVFKKNKNAEMPLYYKLDSHWADYGAYLAYVELFEHISQKFPAASPRAVNEFKWNEGYYTSADVTFYLGIPQTSVDEYAYYRQFNFAADSQITSVPRYRGNQLLYNDRTTYEYYFDTNRSDLPSCIIHRDSFSAAIFDLIPERMDVTHYMGMWSYGWQSYLVQSERPDYVIYLVAEWNLDSIVYN